MKTECKKCSDALITNIANNKEFYYCRTCKTEKSSYGYDIPVLEDPPIDIVRGVHKDVDEFWDQYTGDTGVGQTLTQDEIDELFRDMYSSGDLT